MGKAFWSKLYGKIRGNHFEKRIKFFKRQRTMGFLPADQLHVYAHFVAFVKKFLDVLGSKLEIVGAGQKPDPYSLYLARIFMFLALLALVFFPLVPELPIVHDLAYGRLHSRGDLDKIKPAFVGETKCVGGFHHAQIRALVVNDSDRGRADKLIDTIASLDSKKV